MLYPTSVQLEIEHAPIGCRTHLSRSLFSFNNTIIQGTILMTSSSSHLFSSGTTLGACFGRALRTLWLWKHFTGLQHKSRWRWAALKGKVASARTGALQTLTQPTKGIMEASPLFNNPHKQFSVWSILTTQRKPKHRCATGIQLNQGP